MQIRIRTKNHNGEFSDAPSIYCPECNHYEVDKTLVKETDFDEHGWYFPVNLVCKNTACKHKWVEKTYTQSL